MYFDVGVRLKRVGKIKPWVVFWKLNVAVDAERPHLRHTVDAPVREVSGGVVGDAGERVGHLFSLMWFKSRCQSGSSIRVRVVRRL